MSDDFIRSFDAIGDRRDVAATSSTDESSAFALLKGMAHELGIAAGVGHGTTHTLKSNLDDPMRAIGLPSDHATTSSADPSSAISLAKGVLTTAGFV